MHSPWKKPKTQALGVLILALAPIRTLSLLTQSTLFGQPIESLRRPRWTHRLTYAPHDALAAAGLQVYELCEDVI